MNDLENKIKSFFESIDCQVEYLLKNKLENPTTLGFSGEEIEIPQYTIIHNGEDIMLNDEKFKKKIEFEKINNIDIDYSYIKDSRQSKGILDDLKNEGYEIIYSKDKK